jgi:hypothetical protein
MEHGAQANYPGHIGMLVITEAMIHMYGCTFSAFQATVFIYLPINFLKTNTPSSIGNKTT